PEEDPVDYPADGGDDGDDEEESSEDEEDEEDDEMDVEADEEEEEHPAPADSVVVAPTAADQAPSVEETEPFETDESAATPPPHPAYRTTARISIPAPVAMPAWTDSEVARLLAISSPPASPLSPWSSPPPQIPFPPLPQILLPPLPILSPAPPPSPIRSLGYRAAMIRLRDEAASTSPPSSQLPSASRREDRPEDRPEVTLPPRKRLDIALGPRYEVGESSSAAAARPAGGFRADYGFVATVDREIMRDPEREVSYGITDSWDEIVETLQGAPVSTDTELGGYVREFEVRVRQDMDEIDTRLDDEQTERQLLAGRLNMLFRDRRAHAYTRQLMETEARMSREAWVRATDASDLVRGEVISLRTTVLAWTNSEVVRLLAISSPPASPLSPWSSPPPLIPFPPPRIPFPPLPPILSSPSPVLSPAPPPSPIHDEQTERQLLAGRLNMLFRDRRAHAYTRQLMETEARMSREAWLRATDASDLVRGDVISLRTTVLGQISKIRELQAADRRRQTVISKLLMIDHMRSTETSESRTALQGQITALQRQVM
nr:hypothetical protein [Tanacetum cinerariifolium]